MKKGIEGNVPALRDLQEKGLEGSGRLERERDGSSLTKVGGKTGF